MSGGRGQLYDHTVGRVDHRADSDRVFKNDAPPRATRRWKLPRLTVSVFWDLAIWMVGLGLVTGLVFPPFAALMGVPADHAFTRRFFVATVLAGLLVGGVNYVLARAVVGQRLRLLAGRMRLVSDELNHATRTGDWSGCQADDCLLEIDSNDELGDSASAFNHLVLELQRSHAIEAAVRDLFQALSSHLELGTLARAALDQLIHHVGVETGAIVVAGDPPRVAAARGLAAAERLTESPGLRDLLSAPPAGAPGAAVHLTGPALAERDGELLAVPVVYRERVLGAVVLEPKLGDDSGAATLLEIFTGAFAIALQNALVHENAELLARLDPLTGCTNRRGGQELLQDAFAAARTTQAPLGVLMIDLDHFKTVNDRYGHQAGDAVLISAAAAARSCLRTSDTLVRHGGEEFLAILPGIAPDQLPRVAERVRERIAAAVSDTDRGRIRVTASIGATRLAEPAPASADELLDQADRALYAAKAQGRNRVVLAWSN
jgi:diguanylate cyclase (GGDEF)-like protein